MAAPTMIRPSDGPDTVQTSSKLQECPDTSPSRPSLSLGSVKSSSLSLTSVSLFFHSFASVRHFPFPSLVVLFKLPPFLSSPLSPNRGPGVRHLLFSTFHSFNWEIKALHYTQDAYHSLCYPCGSDRTINRGRSASVPRFGAEA